MSGCFQFEGINVQHMDTCITILTHMRMCLNKKNKYHSTGRTMSDPDILAPKQAQNPELLSDA